MNSEKTPFTARADFPVKRMLRMIVLGNLMTTGGIYLLGIAVETILATMHQAQRGRRLTVRFLAESVEQSGGKLIDLLIKYPGILFVLFALGGLASMIWYVVARRIETREMKKRWLIIQKTTTAETE